MAEKRGETGKLLYDFNTAGVVEIFLNNDWRRASINDFRSFDGPRRVTEPTQVILGNVDVPMKVTPYDGPVYLFGTNKQVDKQNLLKIITSSVWEQARAYTQKRGV